MNKQRNTVLKFGFAAGLLAATFEAGVPLNGLQGNGGIAFNPLAYTAGTYAEGEKGGWAEWVSKPQVGAWYVNLDDADINWYAAGAAFSIAKRLELSVVDRVEPVESAEAVKYARRLAKEEGIVVGISSGAGAGSRRSLEGKTGQPGGQRATRKEHT